MSDGSVCPPSPPRDVRQKSVPLALREMSKMLDKRVSIYPVPRWSTKERPSSPSRDLSDVRQKSVYLPRPENSAMFDGSVSVPRAFREISAMFDGSVSVPRALREISEMFDKRVTIYPVQRSPRCSTKECLFLEPSERSPRCSTEACPSSHRENPSAGLQTSDHHIACQEISATFNERKSVLSSPYSTV